MKLKTIKISYDPGCSGYWDKYANVSDYPVGSHVNGGMHFTVERFIEKRAYDKLKKEIKALRHYCKNKGLDIPPSVNN